LELCLTDELKVFHQKLSNVGFEITLYSQLYVTVKSTQTLNEFNPLFFGVVQKNMYVSICLELAKLLDPPGKGSNKNFSVGRLIASFNLSGDTEIKELLDASNELYKSSIKKFRDQVLAHNDYDLAMKRKILSTNGNITDLKSLGDNLYKLYSLVRFKSGKDSAKCPAELVVRCQEN